MVVRLQRVNEGSSPVGLAEMKCRLKLSLFQKVILPHVRGKRVRTYTVSYGRSLEIGTGTVSASITYRPLTLGHVCLQEHVTKLC